MERGPVPPAAAGRTAGRVRVACRGTTGSSTPTPRAHAPELPRRTRTPTSSRAWATRPGAGTCCGRSGRGRGSAPGRRGWSPARTGPPGRSRGCGTGPGGGAVQNLGVVPGVPRAGARGGPAGESPGRLPRAPALRWAYLGGDGAERRRPCGSTAGPGSARTGPSYKAVPAADPDPVGRLGCLLLAATGHSRASPLGTLIPMDTPPRARPATPHPHPAERPDPAGRADGPRPVGDRCTCSCRPGSPATRPGRRGRRRSSRKCSSAGPAPRDSRQLALDLDNLGADRGRERRPVQHRPLGRDAGPDPAGRAGPLRRHRPPAAPAGRRTGSRPGAGPAGHPGAGGLAAGEGDAGAEGAVLPAAARPEPVRHGRRRPGRHPGRAAGPLRRPVPRRTGRSCPWPATIDWPAAAGPGRTAVRRLGRGRPGRRPTPLPHAPRSGHVTKDTQQTQIAHRLPERRRSPTRTTTRPGGRSGCCPAG